MSTLEEKIILHIYNHPGSRKREVASALNMGLVSSEFRKAFNSLVARGILRRESNRDHANMEYYEIWFIVAP